MGEPNILEKIIGYKREEVRKRKLEIPGPSLEKKTFFRRDILSMKRFLADPARTGIIAEFKRQSPSRGVINASASVLAVTEAYTRNGASALSVLTDTPSFGGSTADLVTARANNIPILRKEFMVDEYQILEARAMGADAILLIAACLSVAETRALAAFAKNLGLETLLEIHESSELEYDGDDIDIVGINNRDLKTFAVDLNRSMDLARRLPENKTVIAESGIRDVETILALKSAGFDGFLIGEQFMKEPDPAIAFASFVDQLKRRLYESKSLRHDAARSGEKT